MSSPTIIRRLGRSDVPVMRKLNGMFGKAFEDEATYGDAPPDDTYLTDFLEKERIVALAALSDEEVIGGLVAYELKKFERARREVYIYDLAVAAEHRRQGIATALIEELRAIAAKRGTYVIFVQADRGDDPAIALYQKLGIREDVVHFDIAVSS